MDPLSLFLFLVASLIMAGVTSAAWHCLVRFLARRRLVRSSDDADKETLPTGWETCPACSYHFPSSHVACPACSHPSAQFLNGRAGK